MIDPEAGSNKPKNNVEQINEWVNFDERVREYDPLEADEFFKTRFRELNESRNMEELLQEAISLSKRTDAFLASPHTREQLFAVHRDFCFLTTALGVRGVDIEAHPEIRDTARRLIELTGESPRDSVYTYIFRNPPGERLRTFSSSEHERALLRGFQIGMDSLFLAIESAEQLSRTPENSAEYVSLCEKIVTGLGGMVEGMREARNIPPDVFMNSIRPYSDPIKFEGKEYFGPGGAQVPIYLVDLLLWSSDSNQEWYNSHITHSAANGPRVYREFAAQLLGKPSALSKLLQHGHGGENASAQSLRKCLLFLRKFRLTHFKVAKSTFAIRGEDAIGSSGSAVTILEQINNALEEAIARVPAPPTEVAE